MIPRTTGALALRPTGNIQGGHYFYSLTTGRRINRNHWTALPMPADVINRVHILARRDKAGAGVSFADRAGITFVDDDDPDASDDDDSSYNPDEDSNNSDSSDSDDDDANADPNHQPIVIAGVNYPVAYIAEVDPTARIAGVNPNVDDNNNDANGDGEEDEDTDEDDDNDVENSEDSENAADDDDAEALDNEDAEAVNNNEAASGNDTAVPTVEQEMEAQYGQQTGHYILRPRRPRDYNHLHATLASTVMTQHSMKKGIKIFGEAGVEAVLQELKQLHDRKVLEPRSATDLSHSEKKAALQYLMFL